MTLVDIRLGLREFLITDAAINAIVAGRVHPIVMPQGQTTPCIVYSRITGVGDHTMEGPTRIARPRFQIDAWALTATLANDLGNLVKERLDGYRGPMPYGTASPRLSVEVLGAFFQNERDIYDEVSKMYAVSRDYHIWHREMS